MRVLIQRTSHATVAINNEIVGKIDAGLLLFLGICAEDNQEDINWLVQKIIHLRIFNDDEGKMNLSIQDIKGEMLVVSQFTLFASVKKGNRPSFIESAKPELAIPLYESFIHHLKSESKLNVETGKFGANMQVQLVNDGPVTIWIDSKNKV